MLPHTGFERFYPSFVISAIILSTAVFMPPGLNAQQLEEIVVTAQRREQNLQEVPISLEVFTGEQLSMQGFSNISDLSKYSPSVTVRDNSNRTIITVRGFGSVGGSSMSLVSSAPFFVDGIHLGSTRMAKLGFLDAERVEVLKGPQPLHFGMSAVSGAFNMTSRRPSAEWEGDLTAEIGNNSSRDISGGIGGPLTETLGIRVAGMYEGEVGPLRNIVTGSKFGGGENLGGRVLLQWTPNDKLDVVTKFEILQRRGSSDLDTGCLTDTPGELRGFVGKPLDGKHVEGADFGNQRALLAGPPNGLSNSPDVGYLWYPEVAEGTDCFKGKYGFSKGGPFLTPPANLVQDDSDDLFDGMPDARAAAHQLLDGEPGIYTQASMPYGGMVGSDDHDAKVAFMELNYRLDNGMNINSQTGLIFFEWHSSEETGAGGQFWDSRASQHLQHDQFSQNLRLESRPEGYDLDFAGGTNMEYMFGLTYQRFERDIHGSTMRPTMREGSRFNTAWENVTWMTGMWELGFNFMDDQLSIAVGGRWTNEKKNIFIQGSASQWVFDQIPCDPNGGDPDPATCSADPNYKWVNPNLTTQTVYDPSNPAQTVTNFGSINTVRVDSPIIVLDGADMDNLWTIRRWRGPTNMPLNYRSPTGVVPVGLTAPSYIAREARGEGPWGDCDSCLADPEMDATDYNSQVVISLTPNALERNHTFYSKYAEAFKGHAWNISGGGINTALDELVLTPEYVKAYELGARGTLLDGRMRYDLSAYRNNYKDVHASVAALFSDPLDQSSIKTNAARQRAQGVEFGFTTAVTQNLTVNLTGALMDVKMLELDGSGCYEDEIIAMAVDVVGNNGGQRGSAPNADEIALGEEYLDAMGPTRRAANLARAGSLPEEFFFNGGCRFEPGIGAGGREYEEETINRSGQKAAFVPDWKIVLGVDYRLPVLDTYEIFFNGMAFVSDEMLMSAESYTKVIMMPKHVDANLMAGFGSQDGTWRVSAYARNLLEAKMSYDPTYDMRLAGFYSPNWESDIRTSSAYEFRSYGVRVEYQF